MQPSRSTRIGLFLLAASLSLSLLGFVLPYVWGAFLLRGAPETILGQSVRVVWIPGAADLLLVATAAVGLLGFVFIWHGRWAFGTEHASRVGLALLAVAGAGVVLGLWAAEGILLGLVHGTADWIVVRHLLAFLGTVFLGFAFYWALTNLPLSGVRAASAVALALGIAGGVVTLLTTLGLRRAQAASLEGAAVALSVASVVLWLSLCLWGWLELRTGRSGRVATSTPSRTG